MRVAANPPALPSLRRTGTPGPNRFDDPQCTYSVRYVADRIRGCLVELLARFRYDNEAERRIAAVVGVDDDAEGAHPGADAVGDWLAVQQVATCQLVEPAAPFVSVNDAAELAALDRHPDVRAVLDTSPLSAPGKPAELDGAAIRLPGAIGRVITQAVSRAVYERDPQPAGIAYRSRLDDNERCFAIYGETPVRFDAPRSLSPAVDGHAVRSAAKLYELALPPTWDDL